MGVFKRTKIDVDKVAKLANLSLSQKEKQAFQEQLEEILSYFSQLDKLNTQNIQPIDHITGLENIEREDVTAPSLSQEDAIQNAPKTHNGFFVVDAIFEEN